MHGKEMLDDSMPSSNSLPQRLRRNVYWAADRGDGQGTFRSLDRTDQAEFSVDDPAPVIGEKIGAYRLKQVLGSGGFASVFLAWDETLDRDVAIKFIRSGQHHIALHEARNFAKFSHPNIVTLLSVEKHFQSICLVMEYLSNGSLQERILRTTTPFSVADTIRIIHQATSAIVFLHQKKVIHRDLKPANLMFDHQNNLKIVDFGLALSIEIPLWDSSVRAGTPNYMAPEQVTGDSRRVDGRTDIWAIGVMMYQLLTGERPFDNKSRTQLFQEILEKEPIPPKQLNPDIPSLLQEICLRCLQKISDRRFSSATELLESLERVVELESSGKVKNDSIPTQSLPHSQAASPVGHDNASPISSNAGDRPSSRLSTKVTPQGLLPFDKTASGFFLDLLPGPHDEFGIPISIKHWLNWIEDEADSFANSVGILHGPSGCGKSSFIQAGLIPLIGQDVRAIYLDFTIREPEKALLQKIISLFPFCESSPDLVSALARIKNAKNQPRVILFFDQFEQYLIDRKIDLQHPIVLALRQCNGKNLKAILLTRSEFWLKISELMGALQIPLNSAVNSRSLALLSKREAEKNLWMFGAAFGGLPAQSLDYNQKRFLKQSVDQLAENDQVLCVRLAMFAELMRTKAWELESLESMGGVNGAIQKFLSQKICDRYSDLFQLNLHEVAMSVLRQMLPSAESETKASAKSVAELRAAIGSADESSIERVLGFLMSELKLITKNSESHEHAPYYQLAHDFLVRPVRNFLDQEQFKTSRGRAIHRIQYLAKAYEGDNSLRNVPGTFEGIKLAFLSRRHARTDSEQSLFKAMRNKALGQISVAIAVSTLVMGASWWGLQQRTKRMDAFAITIRDDLQRLLSSSDSELPIAVGKLPGNRSQADYQRQLAAISPSSLRKQHRKTLLEALLVQDCDALAASQAISTSDRSEVILWRNALQDKDLRENLMPYLQEQLANGDCPYQIAALVVLHDEAAATPCLDRFMTEAPEKAVKCISFVQRAKPKSGKTVPTSRSKSNSTFWQTMWLLEQHKTYRTNQQMTDADLQFAASLLNSAHPMVALNAWNLVQLPSHSGSIDFAELKLEDNPNVRWLRSANRSPLAMIRIPESDFTLESASHWVEGSIGEQVWITHQPIDNKNWNDSRNDTSSNDTSTNNLERTSSSEASPPFGNLLDCLTLLNMLSEDYNLEPRYLFPTDADETDKWREDTNLIEMKLPACFMTLKGSGFRLPNISEYAMACTLGNSELAIELYRLDPSLSVQFVNDPLSQIGISEAIPSPFLAAANPLGFVAGVGCDTPVTVDNSFRYCGSLAENKKMNDWNPTDFAVHIIGAFTEASATIRPTLGQAESTPEFELKRR